MRVCYSFIFHNRGINGHGKKLRDICKSNVLCMFSRRGGYCMAGKEAKICYTVVNYVIGSAFPLTRAQF